MAGNRYSKATTLWWLHSIKYGPATLVMSKLYAQMESYIKYFWPSAVSTETHPKNLFINWGGSSMDPRSVMHALTTELGHTGIEKRLTCNPIHHLAFTLLSGLLSERDLKRPLQVVNGGGNLQ